MTKSIVLGLFVFATSILNAQNLEVEIGKLAGTYVGKWTMYKHINGNVEKAISWMDTLICESPVINDTLAYLTVKSKMIFDNPQIQPYNMEFQEGFELSENNELMHYFQYMEGKFYEKKINENTYIISQPISQFELGQLGFTSAKSAYNTTIKIVVSVNGQEVHQISRISTLIIQNNDREETIQFVSMNGYHKKIE